MTDSYVKKFKSCKSFNPNHYIKPHTPRFPAADRETIHSNSLYKSTVKFLYQPQDRRKDKSGTEKIRRNCLRQVLAAKTSKNR